MNAQTWAGWWRGRQDALEEAVRELVEVNSFTDNRAGGLEVGPAPDAVDVDPRRRGVDRRERALRRSPASSAPPGNPAARPGGAARAPGHRLPAGRLRGLPGGRGAAPRARRAGHEGRPGGGGLRAPRAGRGVSRAAWTRCPRCASWWSRTRRWGLPRAPASSAGHRWLRRRRWCSSPGGRRTRSSPAARAPARSPRWPTGKAAHAGNAHAEGKNAIWALARWIDAVQQLTDYDRGVTVNVGKISGGQGKNTVPDRAEAQADIRYVTRVDGEALVAADARPRRSRRRRRSRGRGSSSRAAWVASRWSERRPAVALMEEYGRAARACGTRGVGGAAHRRGIGRQHLGRRWASPPSTGSVHAGKGFHTVEEHIEVETLVPKTEALARFLVGWRADPPVDEDAPGSAPARRTARPAPLPPARRPGPARGLPPRVSRRGRAAAGDRPRQGHRRAGAAGPGAARRAGRTSPRSASPTRPGAGGGSPW